MRMRALGVLVHKLSVTEPVPHEFIDVRPKARQMEVPDLSVANAKREFFVLR